MLAFAKGKQELAGMIKDFEAMQKERMEKAYASEIEATQSASSVDTKIQNRLEQWGVDTLEINNDSLSEESKIEAKLWLIDFVKHAVSLADQVK